MQNEPQEEIARHFAGKAPTKSQAVSSKGSVTSMRCPSCARACPVLHLHLDKADEREIETIVRVQARLRRRQEELYRAEPSNQWLVLGPERRVYATAQFCAPRRWCARKTRPSYGCEIRSAAAAFEATASLRARDRQGRFAPPSAGAFCSS